MSLRLKADLPTCRSIVPAMPSTMMTAPSTMIPKSMAPRLMRFAHTPKMRIMMNAKSSDSGMTDAVMMPPRRLPMMSTSTKTTMRAPSMRLRAMVLVVRSMRLVRSRNGRIVMPFGRDFCTSASLSLVSFTTFAELAPLSMSIMPPTASWPSWVKAP